MRLGNGLNAPPFFMWPSFFAAVTKRTSGLFWCAVGITRSVRCRLYIHTKKNERVKRYGYNWSDRVEKEISRLPPAVTAAAAAAAEPRKRRRVSSDEDEARGKVKKIMRLGS